MFFSFFKFLCLLISIMSFVSSFFYLSFYLSECFIKFIRCVIQPDKSLKSFQAVSCCFCPWFPLVYTLFVDRWRVIFHEKTGIKPCFCAKTWPRAQTNVSVSYRQLPNLSIGYIGSHDTDRYIAPSSLLNCFLQLCLQIPWLMYCMIYSSGGKVNIFSFI